MPEVHRRVEGVAIVGERIAADGHQADHAKNATTAVFKTSERGAQRQDTGGKRAARPAREDRSTNESRRSLEQGLVDGHCDMQLRKHGLSAMESVRGKVGVQTREGPPRFLGNRIPAVLMERLAVVLRRAADNADAPQRQAVVAANLPAQRRAVTIGESTQQIVTLVDDDRHSAIERIASVSHSKQHQWRSHAAALVAGVPDATGQSARRFDEPGRIDAGGFQ